MLFKVSAIHELSDLEDERKIQRHKEKVAEQERERERLTDRESHIFILLNTIFRRLLRWVSKTALYYSNIV